MLQAQGVADLVDGRQDEVERGGAPGVRINVDDVEAVGPIFGALEPALRIAIRRRLGRRLRVEVDSNDVLQSVFAAAVVGVGLGDE